MSKRIAVWRIVDYWHCPRMYRDGVQQGREKKMSTSEAIGRATHAVVSGTDRGQAVAFLERELRHEPEAERDAAIRRTVALAETCAEMTPESVSNDHKEVQLSWFDELTGWEIFAKPDELFYFQDDRGLGVMQITDNKTAQRMKRKYKDELFLFGLVASMAEQWRYSIRLVCRLLGSRTEETFWFSQREIGRALQKLRSTLSSIERSWAGEGFEETPGYHCHGCRFRPNCADGQNWLEMRQAETNVDVQNPHVPMSYPALVQINGLVSQPVPCTH